MRGKQKLSSTPCRVGGNSNTIFKSVYYYLKSTLEIAVENSPCVFDLNENREAKFIFSTRQELKSGARWVEKEKNYTILVRSQHIFC